MPGVLKLEGTNIATGDGNGAVTLSSGINFPAGHIIQTQYYSAGFTFNTSSTSFVKVTGSPNFEKTITPLKADSNIMIVVSSSVYSGSGYAYLDIYKNASDFTETNNLSGKATGVTLSHSSAHWNPLHYTFIAVSYTHLTLPTTPYV